MFVVCFKLCSFYGCHFTLPCSCVNTTTNTIHAVHFLLVCCLSYALFYGCHYYCAGSWVSTTTDATHTVHSAAYQYQLQFSACCFYLCYFYGCHCIVQTLVSASPLTLHIQFQFFSLSPLVPTHASGSFMEVFNSSAQALTLGRSGHWCQMMRHDLCCVSCWWGLPSVVSSPSLMKTKNKHRMAVNLTVSYCYRSEYIRSDCVQPFFSRNSFLLEVNSSLKMLNHKITKKLNHITG